MTKDQALIEIWGLVRPDQEAPSPDAPEAFVDAVRDAITELEVDAEIANTRGGRNA